LGTPLALPLNINTFVSWVRANGQGNWTAGGAAGGIYPRATSTAIYVDGFEFAGKPYLNAEHTLQPGRQHEVRAGGQSYDAGTREGRIIGEGSAALPADTADPDVRIYRIRRDYAVMSDDDVRRDAAEVGEKLLADVTPSDMDAIRNAYAKDWAEWPVAYGAPFIERNGIPGFQNPPAFSDTFSVDSLIEKGFDEPGICGLNPGLPADQVLWTVYNDLDSAVSTGLWGCDPTGLEFQLTVWGYNRVDALGACFFKKYRIINKGGCVVDSSTNTKGAFYLDSLYFCQWSDPDLGGSGDDLTGCDSTLGMGFVYNGGAIDAEYSKFGLPPPAVGYDILRGPVAESPGNTALLDGRQIPGFRNLPMTSFGFFSAGSSINDPPENYEGARRWYRMMQGYAPDPSTSPLRYYPSGPFPQSPFPLSGDPASGTGFVDGLGNSYSLSPGDRRLLLNAGPVTLAPGDTQEVVIGVVGGIGSDRLSSIAVMKFNDQAMQAMYENNFGIPTVPQLLSPPHNARLDTGTVSFAWQKASESDTLYWHELSTDSLFAVVTIDSTITGTMCERSDLGAGRYWWRVRAKGTGEWTSYSDARRFDLTLTNLSAGASIPANLTLDQNYPNPFNPSTTIRYGVPERMHVTLSVFSVLGQHVADLVNGVQEAGYHGVQFDAAGMATGIYLCRIQAGASVETKKLLLLR
jgi:hypothetical protein